MSRIALVFALVLTVASFAASASAQTFVPRLWQPVYCLDAAPGCNSLNT